MCGISTEYLSQIERGLKSPARATRLAAELQLTVGALMGDAPEAQGTVPPAMTSQVAQALPLGVLGECGDAPFEGPRVRGRRGGGCCGPCRESESRQAPGLLGEQGLPDGGVGLLRGPGADVESVHGDARCECGRRRSAAASRRTSRGSSPDRLAGPGRHGTLRVVRIRAR
ncbi:helix-turn-helix domain-containing protein [Streptomyces sp. NPDC002932]|uniref:helix-turn-helix domain-containing protein n=1 Tax=Streptomyces sp. NPDC002932 TaxID=3364672 RepID=UPI003677B567